MAGRKATEQALGDDLRAGPAPRPLFTRISQNVSKAAGKPATFIGAVAVILIWGATGPLFGFNDTWQLIINTSTTIITFLMVFLIQNSQNRDTAALQIKLDELIARIEGPRKALLDLEDLDEETLEKLRAEYGRLADEARGAADEGADVSPVDRSIQEICAAREEGVEVTVRSTAAADNKTVAEATATRTAARLARKAAGEARAGEAVPARRATRKGPNSKASASDGPASTGGINR